jgi:hypothetical protein
VKPDEDTLLTVPTAPPAAGPDRALDPLAPDPKPPVVEWPLLLAAVVVVALLDVAAMIPAEPLPITTAATPAAMTLLRALENIL